MSKLSTPAIPNADVNGRDVKILPAAQVEALFGTVDLSRPAHTDHDCEAMMFQFGGAPAVLEAVAHGRLVSEIAVQLNMPVMWFNDWVDRNVSGADMARALKYGAETLIVKAQLVLSVDAYSAHEAAQARALSAEFIRVAEKLDHQKWGSRRADGLAGQTVNISMDLGGGKSISSAVTVDGSLDPRNRVIEEAEQLPERMEFSPLDPDTVLRDPIVIDLHCEVPDDGQY